MSLHIRRAIVPDLDFVLDVQKRAMSPAIIAQRGTWSDVLQRQNTNPQTIGTYDVLSWEGEDVGVQQLYVHEDHIEFARLYVAPEHQGRGIGTAVAQWVFALADERRLPIRIRVLRSNPRARAGYERVGFVVTCETDTHTLLERGAPGGEGPSSSSAV